MKRSIAGIVAAFVLVVAVSIGPAAVAAANPPVVCSLPSLQYLAKRCRGIIRATTNF